MKTFSNVIQKRFLRRIFTFFHVMLYRLTNGRLGGRMNGLPVLLLYTIGCKTGKERITPLGYFEHEGDYVVTVSNAAMNSHPGWYYNLAINQQVNIQLNSNHYLVIPLLAKAEEGHRLWESLVGISPAYQAYAKKARRVIPIVILRRDQSTRLNDIL